MSTDSSRTLPGHPWPDAWVVIYILARLAVRGLEVGVGGWDRLAP
jgi:hypothetical protein